MVNFTEEALTGLKEYDLETLKNERYAGHAQFESQEEFEEYIDEEIRNVQDGSAVAALKKLSNFSTINSDDLMEDLLKSVNWAKYRLQPVVLIQPKPAPVIEPKPQRKSSITEPVPVLKKTVNESRVVETRGVAANRSESGSKKRVTINEVPEFEPSAR